MAAGVVAVLIGKLGAALVNEATTLGASLIFKEASALKGLFGEILDVKEELESMEAYLQGAERFKKTDETTGIFVKKIRGLAFEIEDVIDEFTYKLEDKHGGFATKITKRIRHVKTWRRLTQRLQEIKKRLKDANERKVRYDMRRTEKEAGCSVGSVDQAFHFAREDYLVGLENNTKVLRQWLTEDSEEHTLIATVWGMGGVGKTTLVSHVYSMVKLDFDCAAWVTVSNNYQVEALLKMMAKGFGVTVDVTNMEKRSLVEAINCFLRGKKYILILDDVWAVGVWFKIRDAFPTDSVGRFVFTSRIHEVALLATANFIIGLEPLKEDHSWQLFCNEVFWKDHDKTCPIELADLAQKFVARCNGLPIAIACIGRLLSCKQPTYSDWENVYRELELQLTNNVILDVNAILEISLEDLPHDLKNCFLYCALFPEDYLITRRRIMRHWITAGFIKEQRNRTLEQVAEGYLNELLNRSLLQVVEKNPGGRVRSCRMHDIMRVLVLNKTTKERFCAVYDGSTAFSAEEVRRLSIQSSNIEQLNQSRPTYLRGIHIFQYDVNINLLKPILKSSVMLSTLDLQGVPIKMLPDEVFDLFNLRFLGLRRTGIETLPEAVGRLQNLEVLDAIETNLLSLPKNIVKLRKLRYLYACQSFEQNEVKPWGGIEVPKGIKYLTGLYALQCIKASLDTLGDAASLIELRTFAVSSVKSKHSSDLCSAISKMNHLVHLSIEMSDEHLLPLEALCLPQTLCKLALQGQLEKKSVVQVLPAWSHLTNLSRLSLRFSKLDEDSFNSLLFFQGLSYLALYKAYDRKTLRFSAGSFPKLRCLRIWDAAELNQVEIEEGAMGGLVELMFRDCPELKFLPRGIEYLTSLEILRLLETSEELVEKLQRSKGPNGCNEDLMKIKNIRNVTVRLRHKGIWKRIR